MRGLLAALLLTACSAENGDDAGPKHHCEPSDRTGIYAVEMVELQGGKCGAYTGTYLGGVVKLKDSYPDPPSAECVIVSEAWKDGGCTLTRSASCSYPDFAGEQSTGTTTQQDDFGSTITGSVHVKLTGKNAFVCESDYTLTAVRQGG